jgi:zinc transport system ATP-binding protein
MVEPNASPLLTLQAISHGFGGEDVLQHVDLTVASGEIVTLIGPNGAGKTTLVRIALGLLAPRDGTVARRPGLTIGYMPQRFHIDPALPLTVRRFLSLARGADAAAIDAALTQVDASGACSSRAPWSPNRNCWCWMSRCAASMSWARRSSTV